MAGNPWSEFDKPADLVTIEQAMAARGLHACAQGEVKLDGYTGFVSGRFYDISFNCSTYNPKLAQGAHRVIEFGNMRHVMQRCAPSRPRGGI